MARISEECQAEVEAALALDATVGPNTRWKAIIAALLKHGVAYMRQLFKEDIIEALITSRNTKPGQAIFFSNETVTDASSMLVTYVDAHIPSKKNEVKSELEAKLESKLK